MARVSRRPRLNREPMTAAAPNVRFAAGSSRSMRAAMVACKVAGTLTSAACAVDTYVPGSPRRHSALSQFPHNLLGKEGVASGSLADLLAQPGD